MSAKNEEKVRIHSWGKKQGIKKSKSVDSVIRGTHLHEYHLIYEEPLNMFW